MKIFDEILAERQRQDAKWGVQNHPSHAGMIGPGEIVLYSLPCTESARGTCDARFKAGIGSWLDIAIEEMAEVRDAALDAVNPFTDADEGAVRAELIQLIAVGVAWVEAIDRRSGRDTEEHSDDNQLAVLGETERWR